MDKGIVFNCDLKGSIIVANGTVLFISNGNTLLHQTDIKIMSLYSNFKEWQEYVNYLKSLNIYHNNKVNCCNNSLKSLYNDFKNYLTPEQIIYRLYNQDPTIVVSPEAPKTINYFRKNLGWLGEIRLWLQTQPGRFFNKL